MTSSIEHCSGFFRADDIPRECASLAARTTSFKLRARHLNTGLSVVAIEFDPEIRDGRFSIWLGVQTVATVACSGPWSNGVTELAYLGHLQDEKFLYLLRACVSLSHALRSTADPI